MKITREEFKELVNICQTAPFVDKDDLINCLVSWISDGLDLKEELFELMDGRRRLLFFEDIIKF
jgi:hypothetical protein